MLLLKCLSRGLIAFCFGVSFSSIGYNCAYTQELVFVPRKKTMSIDMAGCLFNSSQTAFSPKEQSLSSCCTSAHLPALGILGGLVDIFW